MEKEIEKYLIKRIKDLESELAYVKGQGDGYTSKELFADGKKIVEEPIDTDKERLEKEVERLHKLCVSNSKKALAFDLLVDVLGIEVCHWVEEHRFEIIGKKVYFKADITESTFDKLWGGINGN